MKKLDYLSQLHAGRMKRHEKEAEIDFSSFDDDGYVGEEENFEDEYDGEVEMFMSPVQKRKAGVGTIKLNTLKLRLVSDGTISAAGVKVPLFGAFANLYLAGFNIPAGVSVFGTPTDYPQVLATSVSKPWIVKGLKIIVGGASPAAQLNQNFSLTVTDLTGRSTTDPYFPSDNFSAFQQQPGIIEMKDFQAEIDGNMQMAYTMLPSQTVDLLFYVKAQVDPTRVAQGMNSLEVSSKGFPNANQQTLVIKKGK
ncbi:MAG TPA: hypothetical protein VF691_04170 [Cytophagaceae bacterium]|jgi:hypothetical protein